MLTLRLVLASVPVPVAVVQVPRAAPKVRLVAGLTAVAALGLSIGVTVDYYENNPLALRGIAPVGIAVSFVPFFGAAFGLLGDAELLRDDPAAAHRMMAHGISLGLQVSGLVMLLLAPLFDGKSLWRVSIVPVANGLGLAWAL